MFLPEIDRLWCEEVSQAGGVWVECTRLYLALPEPKLLVRVDLQGLLASTFAETAVFGMKKVSCLCSWFQKFQNYLVEGS